MAIAFENAATALGYGAVTISGFSAGSNADRVVVVMTTWEYLGTAEATTDVTYGGVSMTKLADYTDRYSNKYCLFYLIGAATSGDIVTSVDDVGIRKSIQAAAFSGVSAVSGYTRQQSAGYTISIPISSATGHKVAAFAWNGSPGAGSRVTPGAGVTEHQDTDTTIHAHWLGTKEGETTATIEGDYVGYREWDALGISLEPAGGGAFTLPSDQGSYSLTGQSAGLLFNRKLAAEHGTHSLTGQDVGLLFNRLVSAGQGSYALTGQDATLTYTQPGVYSLTAESGTYNWTVSDAFADYTMVALHGTYDLTGQDATLTLTGAPPQDYVMSVDAGYYSLTGRTAALRWSGAPIVPSSGTGLSMSMRIGL